MQSQLVKLLQTAPWKVNLNKACLSNNYSQIAKEILGEGEPFKVSGNNVWNSKMPLGQTQVAISFVIIENKKIQQLYQFEKCRYCFMKTEFPEDDDSLEWWIVDMMNWFFITDVSPETMALHLQCWIEEDPKVVNLLKLEKMAKQFGTEKTQNALNCVLL